MAEISYKTVMDVTMSWDALKRTKDFQTVAGEMIFARLFQLEPECKAVFKFSPSEDYRSNPSFARQARAIVDMIDFAVGFLGPDLDPLKEDLYEIGKRHGMYGVEPKYFDSLGKALEHTLEHILGPTKFNEDDKASWSVVYQFLAEGMIKGMLE